MCVCVGGGGGGSVSKCDSGTYLYSYVQECSPRELHHIHKPNVTSLVPRLILSFFQLH